MVNMNFSEELVKLHKSEQSRRETLTAFRLNEVSALESEAEKFSMLFLGNGSEFQPNPSLLENSQEARDLMEKIKNSYQNINDQLDAFQVEYDPNSRDGNFIQGIKRLRDSVDHYILKAERASGITIIGIPDWLNEEVE
jgi:hypothetical protein